MLIPSEERFTETADRYARWRPGYPRELALWLIETAGLARGAAVLDLGCGTGISSRLLASEGLAVTGVDPNDAMLAHARREGGATYVKGTSVATGVPDRAFDLAVGAQA